MLNTYFERIRKAFMNIEKAKGISLTNIGWEVDNHGELMLDNGEWYMIHSMTIAEIEKFILDALFEE